MQKVQDPPAVLTIRDVAALLRCSKTHVANALKGKIPGVPRLSHISMGRRKLVRREWLDQWLEASKQNC
jgi:excisionase family DNA binding protein